jgi:hypothetical protein
VPVNGRARCASTIRWRPAALFRIWCVFVVVVVVLVVVVVVVVVVDL